MSGHLREEEFIPYLDGRLSEAERARLDQHLAACAECRARCDELKAVLGILGEWKGVEPSPGFDAALRARLAEEGAAAAPWYSLRPAFAAALAVALVLAAVFVLWEPGPPEPGPLPVARAPEEILPPSGTDVSEDLAVLDNKVLMENYELLQEFDILFEPVEEEEEKL